MKKELWLHNDTGADVSVADLGVKVNANKTINVYAYNPYLTKEQVERSMEAGSLSKRLVSKTLRVVSGYVSPQPHGLDHVKSSDKPMEVVKVKSAVYVDTKKEDVLEDGDFGDIADYGLGELGHDNTINTKTRDGSVVVSQKQDDDKSEVPESILHYMNATSKGTNESPIVAVGDATDLVKSEENILVTPPEAEPVDEPVVEKPMKLAAKESGDSVVVDSEESFDAQAATSDTNGKAVVMKLKETGEVPEPEKA